MRTSALLVNVLRFATSMRGDSNDNSNFYKARRKKLQDAVQEWALMAFS